MFGHRWHRVWCRIRVVGACLLLMMVGWARWRHRAIVTTIIHGSVRWGRWMVPARWPTTGITVWHLGAILHGASLILRRHRLRRRWWPINRIIGHLVINYPSRLYLADCIGEDKGTIQRYVICVISIVVSSIYALVVFHWVGSSGLASLETTSNAFALRLTYSFGLHTYPLFAIITLLHAHNYHSTMKHITCWNSEIFT